MASSAPLRLLKESALDSDKTGAAASLPPQSNSHVGVLIVNNQAGANIDVKIQHSPDGINWIDKASFATATANGVEVIAIADPLLGSVRAVATVNAGQADIICDIRHGLYK
jgi:hypothetical protein